jgi:integrase
MLGEIAHGKDPAGLLREGRRSSRAILHKALEDYEASLRRRRTVNISTIMSSLRRGLSRLMKREVATITRGDYVVAIGAVEERGKPGAAEYLRKNARTFAEWAVTRGLSPHNPLAGLRRPKATRAERLEIEERGRALSDPEVVAIWETTTKSSHSFGALVKLGLLTGMRRGELASLGWSSVKSDRIVLEATHTKQGRRHEIPLTVAMREVLAATPRGTSKLVFPSWKTNKLMSGWKKMTARLVRASGVQFTLHDLRRTCRTCMTNTGTSEDIAEIAIGHQRNDLIRRYDFSEVWGQRVDAFERVSRHVMTLLGRDSADVLVMPVKVGTRRYASIVERTNR